MRRCPRNEEECWIHSDRARISQRARACICPSLHNLRLQFSLRLLPSAATCTRCAREGDGVHRQDEPMATWGRKNACGSSPREAPQLLHRPEPHQNLTRSWSEPLCPGCSLLQQNAVSLPCWLRPTAAAAAGGRRSALSGREAGCPPPPFPKIRSDVMQLHM